MNFTPKQKTLVLVWRGAKGSSTVAQRKSRTKFGIGAKNSIRTVVRKWWNKIMGSSSLNRKRQNTRHRTAEFLILAFFPKMGTN
jgi:hypothetical protein